jgi:hypothetical protein
MLSKERLTAMVRGFSRVACPEDLVCVIIMGQVVAIGAVAKVFAGSLCQRLSSFSRGLLVEPAVASQSVMIPSRCEGPRAVFVSTVGGRMVACVLSLSVSRLESRRASIEADRGAVRLIPAKEPLGRWAVGCSPHWPWAMARWHGACVSLEERLTGCDLVSGVLPASADSLLFWARPLADPLGRLRPFRFLSPELSKIKVAGPAGCGRFPWPPASPLPGILSIP